MIVDKKSGIKGPPGGAATPGKAFVMVYPQVANYKGDLTVAVAIRKEGKIAATIHPFVLPTQRGIAIEKKKNYRRERRKQFWVANHFLQ